jgi:hypothetical protein
MRLKEIQPHVEAILAPLWFVDHALAYFADDPKSLLNQIESQHELSSYHRATGETILRDQLKRLDYFSLRAQTSFYSATSWHANDSIEILKKRNTSTKKWSIRPGLYFAVQSESKKPNVFEILEDLILGHLLLDQPFDEKESDPMVPPATTTYRVLRACEEGVRWRLAAFSDSGSKMYVPETSMSSSNSNSSISPSSSGSPANNSQVVGVIPGVGIHGGPSHPPWTRVKTSELDILCVCLYILLHLVPLPLSALQYRAFVFSFERKGEGDTQRTVDTGLRLLCLSILTPALQQLYDISRASRSHARIDSTPSELRLLRGTFQSICFLTSLLSAAYQDSLLGFDVAFPQQEHHQALQFFYSLPWHRDSEVGTDEISLFLAAHRGDSPIPVHHLQVRAWFWASVFFWRGRFESISFSFPLNSSSPTSSSREEM